MEKKQEAAAAAKGEGGEIWDCGSCLYDSFELKAFERHLYSAIHSRTLSMPHLSDRRRVLPLFPHPEPPPPSSNPSDERKKSNPSDQHKKSPAPSKIARSFRKLIRSVFKWKKQNSKSDSEEKCKDGVYNNNKKHNSASLTTILEAQELDGRYLRSPSARQTASNRITPTAGGAWA